MTHKHYLSILWFAIGSLAWSQPDCTGSWEGKLKASGMSLTVRFHLSQDENNTLTATMDSPDQGALGIPVNEVQCHQKTIVLTVKVVGGEYHGQFLNTDTWEGTWKQNGMEFPLKLTRMPVKTNPPTPPLFKEEECHIETETGKVFGILQLPNTAPPYPVALIIAGSGATDRDGNSPFIKNNSLKMLAEGLLKKGIATLRYDKRGIGKSFNQELDESKLRFEHLVQDVVKWSQFLKSDQRLRETTVIGHSEGSLIGMLASQQNTVAKFVSIAGTGRTADLILKEQLTSQPDSIQKEAFSILDQLAKGKLVPQIPENMNALFRPSVQPYLISWFQYDPKAEIAKLNKPILIIQGTTDIQVPVRDSEILSQANTACEYRLIEGMNHIMKQASTDRQENLRTYSQPDLPLMAGLVDGIAAFILK